MRGLISAYCPQRYFREHRQKTSAEATNNIIRRLIAAGSISEPLLHLLRLFTHRRSHDTTDFVLTPEPDRRSSGVGFVALCALRGHQSRNDRPYVFTAFSISCCQLSKNVFGGSIDSPQFGFSPTEQYSWSMTPLCAPPHTSNRRPTATASVEALPGGAFGARGGMRCGSRPEIRIKSRRALPTIRAMRSDRRTSA